MKQAAVIISALFLVFLGLMLISSPLPNLVGIGAAFLLAGIGIFLYFQIYVYLIKWERFLFECILLRWPDATRDLIILARDPGDPENEKLLSELDVRYFSSIAPSSWMQAPLYWYMWKGATNDRDEYFITIGTPTIPQNLGKYTKETVYFRGWFTRVWVRDIEADGLTRIDVSEPVETINMRLARRIRSYDLDKYSVPVALVTGSDWHTQIRTALTLGVLPEGARAAEVPVLGINADQSLIQLREIVAASSTALINMWNEETKRWRDAVVELQKISHRSSPIEIETRGFSMLELQPAQPAPARGRKALLIAIAIVICVVAVALVFLRGVV
ncbi:MAG: hypothetical protein QXP38_00100 [Nitrososphaerota archaeon]